VHALGQRSAADGRLHRKLRLARVNLAPPRIHDSLVTFAGNRAPNTATARSNEHSCKSFPKTSAIAFDRCQADPYSVNRRPRDQAKPPMSALLKRVRNRAAISGHHCARKSSSFKRHYLDTLQPRQAHCAAAMYRFCRILRQEEHLEEFLSVKSLASLGSQRTASTTRRRTPPVLEGCTNTYHAPPAPDLDLVLKPADAVFFKPARQWSHRSGHAARRGFNPSASLGDTFRMT